ncbi:peptidyl-Lys metalloendopeptidase [Stigmatella aurantiaca]|uniref:Peptidyl-Lys metalloendopeptidase n=1 Tax=Stigmatella aurantiaca TaxID=41 RepID=A0A1H7QQE1_STIAU|nr:M35 family metallo-endopeptidase [Stigmatella aurantiaca]SEL50153.1 peptidyl-Lys metalloendopeptidase [Stigmatella aurantiaca]
MSKRQGGRLRGLCGAGAGLLLLGACGAPPEGPDDASPLGAVEAATGGLSAHLSAAATSLRAEEEVSLTLALTNPTAHPVRLLVWNTPAQGLTENLLTVTFNGAPVEYRGPHFKRAIPRPEDFLVLAPGESLTRTVTLSGVYDWSRSGPYTVRYTGVGPESFSSNSLTLWVSGRPAPQEPLEAPPAAAPGLSYRQCSDSQKSDIAQAFTTAQSMAHRAVSYLSETPPIRAPRYKTWFGAATATGWLTVRAHFNTLKRALNTKPVVVDCGCTRNAYAYVYSHRPYTIYVCNAFWSAPMTGTDSKGGTLIHEMSHFHAVAGTEDHAYGQSAAKSLALSHPSKARDNADSHEYFAENTPMLR